MASKGIPDDPVAEGDCGEAQEWKTCGREIGSAGGCCVQISVDEGMVCLSEDELCHVLACVLLAPPPPPSFSPPPARPFCHTPETGDSEWRDVSRRLDIVFKGLRMGGSVDCKGVCGGMGSVLLKSLWGLIT